LDAEFEDLFFVVRAGPCNFQEAEAGLKRFTAQPELRLALLLLLLRVVEQELKHVQRQIQIQLHHRSEDRRPAIERREQELELALLPRLVFILGAEDEQDALQHIHGLQDAVLVIRSHVL